MPTDDLVTGPPYGSHAMGVDWGGPGMWDSGALFQYSPDRTIRFLPEERVPLIATDYSQLESRIIEHLGITEETLYGNSTATSNGLPGKVTFSFKVKRRTCWDILMDRL